MQNVKFDGISEDLTAPGTPWIYYSICDMNILEGLLQLAIGVHMQELTQRTWGSSIPTLCGKLSLQVVSVCIWDLLPLYRTLPSCDTCFLVKLAIHGCHLKSGRSRMFFSSCEVYRNHWPHPHKWTGVCKEDAQGSIWIGRSRAWLIISSAHTSNAFISVTVLYCHLFILPFQMVFCHFQWRKDRSDAELKMKLKALQNWWVSFDRWLIVHFHSYPP